MPNEPTPSAGGSATPTPAQPATGIPPTPSTSGATPPTKTAEQELEEAKARLAELERKHSNASEELERHRKNAKKLADYEAAEQAARDAQLSEIERVKQQAAAAEQQSQQLKQQLVMTQVKLAAQSKGIIDPDMAALAIKDSLEYGEDGMPNNLDKALDTLIKNKPYLAPPAQQQQAPATPAQTAMPPAQQTPAIPAMNPGRSNIPSPSTANPPGRVPRLSDLGVFSAPGTRSPWQP
jgi:hypothetical protein